MTPDPAAPADVVAHAVFVRRLAFHLLHHDADADDAAQETLAAALARPPRPGPGVRAWLAAILRNVVRRGRRTSHRRKRRERSASVHDRTRATDSMAERQEILRAVVDAVRRLDPAHHEVVLLRHYEGLAPRTIAARLGIPVVTVKSRLWRAHERLRGLLDERHRGNVAGWRSALGAFAGWDGAVKPPSTVPIAAARTGGVIMTLSTKLASGAAAVIALGAIWWLGIGPDETPIATEQTRDATTVVPDVETSAALARAPDRGVAPPPPHPMRLEVPPPGSPGEELVTLRVLDVADGKPVPEIRVRIGLEGSAEGLELVSDADGRVAVAWPELSGRPADFAGRPAGVRPRHVTTLTTGWRSTGLLGSTVLETRAIPVFRLMRVRGRVLVEEPGANGPDLSQVQLVAHALPDKDASKATATPDDPRPGTSLWISRHGMHRIPLSATPGRDGTFDAEIPRLSRIALTAVLDGFMSLPLEVTVPPGDDRASDVVLSLRRAPVVSGFLRDTTGRALADVRIDLHVLRWFDGTPPLEALAAHPRGERGTVNTDASGRTLVRTVLGTQTDSQGRLSIAVTSAGQGTIFVHPSGFLPLWEALGTLSADKEVTLVTSVARGVPVTFLRDGRPIAAKIALTDVTHRDVQIHLGSIESDANGRALVPWLEAGHAYHLRSSDGAGDGYLRWSGTAEIDLASLGKFSDVHPSR